MTLNLSTAAIQPNSNSFERSFLYPLKKALSCSKTDTATFCLLEWRKLFNFWNIEYNFRANNKNWHNEIRNSMTKRKETRIPVFNCRQWNCARNRLSCSNLLWKGTLVLRLDYLFLMRGCTQAAHHSIEDIENWFQHFQPSDIRQNWHYFASTFFSIFSCLKRTTNGIFAKKNGSSAQIHLSNPSFFHSFRVLWYLVFL